MTRDMATFTIKGEEIITKTVGNGGYSGRIYVPIDWLGDNVKVVRLSRKKGGKGDSREKGVKGIQGKKRKRG